jgi:hypothetical protein
VFHGGADRGLLSHRYKKRDQDPDADARSALTVPQFVPLRLSYLYGRGLSEVLDGDNAAVDAISCEPIPFVLGSFFFLDTDLNAAQRRYRVHRVREVGQRHGWRRRMRNMMRFIHDVFVWIPLKSCSWLKTINELG